MRARVLLFLLVVAIAGALLVGAEQILEPNYAQVVLLVGVVATSLLVIASFRAERALPLLTDPLVLTVAFLAQFFVIGALAAPFFQFYRSYALTIERLLGVLGAFILLLACFFVGYRVQLGEMVASVLPTFGRGSRKLPGHWGVLLVLVPSVAGCIAYVWVIGGVEVILRMGYGGVSGPPMFQIAFHGLLAATLLWAWRLSDTPSVGRPAHLAFWAFLALEIFYFAVLIGARKRLFYLAVGLVAIWLLRHGIAGVSRARIALGMAILLVFFSVWGSIRSRPVYEILGRQGDFTVEEKRGAVLEYFRNVAEPIVVASMIMEVFPEQQPYSHGRGLLVVLLGFIPRAVWPDKPVGISKELTRYTDGVFYNPKSGHSITPTILGDLYVNLGLLGVGVGGFLLGLSCRTASVYAVTGMRDGRQQQAARVLLPVVFLAGLVEVRADSAQMLAFYAMTYPPVLFALLFFRMDQPASEEEVA